MNIHQRNSRASGTIGRAIISGESYHRYVSTRMLERQNLTIQMQMRQLIRLTTAFSKKIENHEAAIALHYMYYNFACVHQTLRVTPAMEAAIFDGFRVCKKLSVCCLDFKGRWVQLFTLDVPVRKRATMRWIGFLAVMTCVISVASCRSLLYIHGACDDVNSLWYSVLKPFDGDVYYVGSDGDYSYFRQGHLFYSRYKAQTSKLKLPRTFPFGKEKPYVVTIDMIPENY